MLPILSASKLINILGTPYEYWVGPPPTPTPLLSDLPQLFVVWISQGVRILPSFETITAFIRLWVRPVYAEFRPYIMHVAEVIGIHQTRRGSSSVHFQ